MYLFIEKYLQIIYNIVKIIESKKANPTKGKAFIM